MKKPLLLVLAVMFCFSLTACAGDKLTASSPTSDFSSPVASTGAITTLALPPELSATSTFTAKEPSADTMIIVSPWGDIYGGYSDGKWLTRSEAAQYCSKPMTLYEFNLAGFVRTVQSDGVSYYDAGGGYVTSWTVDADTDDDNNYYTLDIPEYVYPEASYSEYPLKFTYLYSRRFDIPSGMQALSDVSDITPVVQGLLDKKFGRGNVEACVRIAIEADIDSDGQKETIVNADNNGDEFEYSYGDLDMQAMEQLWYCMCFIIESDGEVVMLDEDYSLNDEDSWFAFFYIQNIVDLDGDGIYEIVMDWSAWETFLTLVYTYDGTSTELVLEYAAGS